MSPLSRIARLKRQRDPEEGQVIVLAALVSLVLVLVVMLTFAIGHRTREKIKLQALADSGAYSLAVAEARAFNYFAFSNRAIIGHYVSILSISSHQSYITWYEQLLTDTAETYSGNPMQAMLKAACICSKLPCSPLTPCGCICKPCSTACDAADKASRIGDLFENFVPGGANWLHMTWHLNKTWDAMLHGGATAHYGVVTAIRAQQLAVQTSLLTQMMGNQGIARSIAQTVDRKIQAPPALSALNIAAYERAVTAQTVRPDDYHEIHNGTRIPTWLTQRGFRPGGYGGLLQATASLTAIPDIAFSTVQNSGSSKTLELDPIGAQGLSTSVHMGGHFAIGFGGKLGAAAEDHGRVTSIYVPLACPCSAIGSISQRPVGVWTEPAGGHGHGTHYFHEGMPEMEPPPSHAMGVCAGLQCGIYQGYMRYKLATQLRDPLWNSPRTFAALVRRHDERQPWDFDFRATLPGPVSFTTVRSRGDAATAGSMAAMASGLVYYHRPTGWGDDWKEPPSLWNPFWRAKLHPLPRTESLSVLTTSHPSSARALQTLTDIDALNY